MQPSETLNETQPPAVGRGNLPWLLFLFALLAVLWMIPYLVEQWSYRREKGSQTALRESLGEMGDLKIESVNKLFVSVAKRLNPSVVHIDTVRETTPRTDEFASLFGPHAQEPQSQGSGVIVDPAGYIVTNYHVIAGATGIQVHLSGGRRDFPATVVGSDAKNDLAVIKIDAPNLIAAPWGNSNDLEVGSMVWAMGNPFGLDNTLTFGIVSAKERRGVNNKQRYQEYLQTDVAVNPGNSGGPLVDLAGKIVGINTAIVGPTYQGISFAIPSNVAKDVYEQIRKQGSVSNGYLGVGLTMVNEEIRKTMGLPDFKGAVVTAVAARSPAEAAGIQAGDVIVRWNDRVIEDPDMLTYQVARTAVGSRARVLIWRNGRETPLEVIVGERPPALKQR
ncbi:MAG: trypsin-like peptidase domain-containing protein [Pirellulales bacterium]